MGTIEQTYKIEAPESKVFEAMTDPTMITQWFGTEVEGETKQGGEFTYKFLFEDASHDHVQKGKYIEVVKDQKLTYTWQTPMGETVVALDLAAADDGTKVSLEHSGWADTEQGKAAQEEHAQGWGGFLGNLKSVLEGGGDIRPTAMGMKIR